ncbi:MAG: hypothetical protein HY289_01345 [Planctomycetes bacterium]|nr:hypothetical protein [Planctomycetota bacterium]
MVAEEVMKEGDTNMTVEHFETTIRAMMTVRPFRAFTIELNTGQRYEIDDPLVAAFSEGAGVVFAPGGIPVFFDHESVNQIINSPAHAAPGRKGKSKRES